MLDQNATEDQIKRKYRSFTLLIHPDKCSLPNATEAFQVLEASWKALSNEDTRSFYQRIMREAKERVELKRKKENRERLKRGLGELPLDNIDSEIREVMQQIINDIEEKKKYAEKMEFVYKKRERDMKEQEYQKEEKEKQLLKEWDNFRDKRVKSWNRFKHKISNGKNKTKYEIKPPRSKIEERIDEQHIIIYRPNSIM